MLYDTIYFTIELIFALIGLYIYIYFLFPFALELADNESNPTSSNEISKNIYNTTKHYMMNDISELNYTINSSFMYIQQ